MKEPWKTDPKRLRRIFDKTLVSIWERWEEFEIPGSPFKNLNDIIDETSLTSGQFAQMFFEVGWLRGVSEANGWSLDNPGPREWSPRI